MGGRDCNNKQRLDGIARKLAMSMCVKALHGRLSMGYVSMMEKGSMNERKRTCVAGSGRVRGIEFIVIEKQEGRHKRMPNLHTHKTNSSS